jgi:hypothetical protein
MSEQSWDEDEKKWRFFPPVDLPVDQPGLTWDALRPLCLVEPAMRHAEVLVDRGELTREQALIAVVYALYNQKAQLFAALVEQKATEVSDFILLDGKRYDRRQPETPWTIPNPRQRLE